MTKNHPKDPLLVVLGATGTGKSQLAVDLAKRFNGEIINGDAMQMYDGLPIITNKMSREEQQGIPHHLLGFIALDDEPWRVGLFKQKAGQIMKEIRSRGRLPILVGGTHYYTQSLLFDETLVQTAPSKEDQLHYGYTNQEMAEKYPILAGSTEDMLKRLQEVDPVMADRWHPKDKRKIRRSLEIYLVSGRRASDIYAEQMEVKAANRHSDLDTEPINAPLVDSRSVLLFWVHAESEILKKRLDARIDKMLASGLLDEVKSMQSFLQKQAISGIEVDRTRGIWVSIGYKEFEPYLKTLDSANASETEIQKSYELSIEQTKAATRQYAKQQVRWIRLKLLPALAEADAQERLYLMDGSVVSRFAETVSLPAIEITDSFLNGGERLPPREVCAAAAQIFDPHEAVEPKDPDFRQECEICHTIFVADSQWQTHLKSRRHRALVKKKQKHSRSGMSRPPPSGSMSEIDTH